LAPFCQAVSEEKILLNSSKSETRIALMLSQNSKHVQHVKIYLACNLKANLITHLEVIALFSSNFKNVNTFHRCS
jgi:hypothetical protein